MPEDSASWYQRKMAQMRGGTAPQPFRQPIPQYQQPQPQYQQNVQQEVAPPGMRPGIGQYQQPETLTELLELQKHGQALSPGKGGKLNREPCPNCGGNLYYADLGLKRRGPPPAPRCFTCGFNELFEQGIEANWQNGS